VGSGFGDLPPPMAPLPSQPPAGAMPLPVEQVGDWAELTPPVPEVAPPSSEVVDLSAFDDHSPEPAFESIGDIGFDLDDDFAELPPATFGVQDQAEEPSFEMGLFEADQLAADAEPAEAEPESVPPAPSTPAPVALPPLPDGASFEEFGDLDASAFDGDDEIELLDDDEIELLDDDEIELLDDDFADDAPMAEFIDALVSSAPVAMPEPEIAADALVVEAVALDDFGGAAGFIDAAADLDAHQTEGIDERLFVTSESMDLDASGLILEEGALDADDLVLGVVESSDELAFEASEPQAFASQRADSEGPASGGEVEVDLDLEMDLDFDASALIVESVAVPPPEPQAIFDVFAGDEAEADAASDVEAEVQAVPFEAPAASGLIDDNDALVADEFGIMDFSSEEPTTEALPSPARFAAAVFEAVEDLPEAGTVDMDPLQAGAADVDAPEAVEHSAEAGPLASLVAKLAKGPKPPAPPTGFGFFDLAPPPAPAGVAAPVSEPLAAEPTPVDVADAPQLDVSELDFMLDSGLVADARELLEELLADHGDDPLLLERRGRIEFMEADSGADEDEDPFGGLIDDALSDMGSVQGSLVSEINDDDASSHFDLGVAYKEMGQYRKAVELLEKAARSPSRRADALRLVGLCHLEQGDAASAVSHLEDALRSPGLVAEGRVGIEFDLATAYEQLGRIDAAIEHLEAIEASGVPVFFDVAGRLARLRG
jgi:hypothetical protein